MLEDENVGKGGNKGPGAVQGLRVKAAPPHPSSYCSLK